MTLDRVEAVANEVAIQVSVVAIFSSVCLNLISRTFLSSLSFLVLVNVGSERLLKFIG